MRSTSGEVCSAEVPSTSLEALRRIDGLVLVAAKAFANAELARRLAAIEGDLALLVVQNGLEVELPFVQQLSGDVYRGVLFTACELGDDGLVELRPARPMALGLVRGVEGSAPALAERLQNALFPISPVDAIEPVVWAKTIVNCAFNSICPLIDADNGVFVRDDRAMTLATKVVTEGVAVASGHGIELAAADLLAIVEQISRTSGGRPISTLQDIRRGRPTEIESLNMALARKADSLGQPELATLTGSLGSLVALRAELASSRG